MTTDLVPYKDTNIVEYVYKFKLVEEDLNLMDRESVKALLPDILSRALARSWIDGKYKDKLSKDVKTTLQEGGVHLPKDYECQYEKSKLGERAKIIVYEWAGTLKLRVCSLHLTMIATR